MSKSPRFTPGTFVTSQSSQTKRRTPRRNTRPEIALRRALWAAGLRYRLHVALVGRPDICFRSARVVVFCDGDFWHGRNWRARSRTLARGANAHYWLAKIAGNMKRDRRVTHQLRAEGWTVLRLWETDILADPNAVCQIVKRVVRAAERRKAGRNQRFATRGRERM